MIVVLAACVVFLGILQGCFAGENSRILNGTDLEIEDMPHMVVIQSFGFLRCGGSIVSSQHILSSANCFLRFPVGNLTVHVGTTYTYQGESIYRVSKIIFHPLFTRRDYSFNHDIAVLILASHLEWSNFVKPVILSGSGSLIGEKVIAAGWGTLSYRRPFATSLQGVILTVMARDECQKYVKQPITTEKLCTSDQNHGICTGDAGGPLVNRQLRQIGIASNVPKECGPPSIFTYVPPYKSFINEATNNSVTWS